MEPELHLRATLGDDRDVAHTTRIKPPPRSSAISAPFSYSPSDDGTDENILVLLHGLGSHSPFSFSFSPFGVALVLKSSRFVSFAPAFSSHSRTRPTRGHPHPLQQTGPLFQAPPDCHARSACTKAVRPHPHLHPWTLPLTSPHVSHYPLVFHSRRKEYRICTSTRSSGTPPLTLSATS